MRPQRDGDPIPTYVVVTGRCLRCGTVQRMAQPLTILGELTECAECREMMVLVHGPAFVLPLYERLLAIILNDALHATQREVQTPSANKPLTAAEPGPSIKH